MAEDKFEAELARRNAAGGAPRAEAAPVEDKFEAELAKRNAPFNPITAAVEGVQAIGEGIVGMVRGKQDPDIDIPGFTGEHVRDRKRFAALQRAKVLGVSDEVYGKLVRKAMAGRLVGEPTFDKHGQEIITYLDHKGVERREYINQPGADLQDLDRLISSSAPFVAGGAAVSAVTKGAPLLGRVAAQALGQTSASVLQDIGAGEGIDVTKGLIAGGGGAAGEIAVPLIRGLIDKFRKTPSLVSATGDLTKSGVAAVERAGLDPLELPPELLEQLTRPDVPLSANQAEAVIRAQQDQFGLRSSIGSRTRDPATLAYEEEARQGLLGEGAKSVVKEFDEGLKVEARAAVEREADRLVPEGIEAPRPTTQGEAGEQLQRGLREQTDITERAISEGFDEVDVKAIFPEGIPEKNFQPLADDILEGLGDDVENLGSFPNAQASVNLLDAFATGKATTPTSKLLKQGKKVPRTFDSVRRSLTRNVSAAERGSPDERAALVVKKAYNKWLGDLADGALESGNPEEFAKLTKAIGFTAESKALFNAQGPKDFGGKILEKIRTGTDSPEGAIKALIPGNFRSKPAEGAVNAATRLKKILGETDPSAWHSIRVAMWLKMGRGKNLFKTGPIQRGELDTALGQVSRNIEDAFENQSSFLKVLFDADELKRIKSFGEAARTSQAVNPNPSGTSFASQRMRQAAKDNILPNLLRRKTASEQLAGQSVRAAGFRQLTRHAVSILGARGEGIAARATGRSLSQRLPQQIVRGGGGLGGAAAVQSTAPDSPGFIPETKGGLLDFSKGLSPVIRGLLQ